MFSTREPDSQISVLVASQRMAPEIILKLGMTSLANHLFILNWILDNLPLLNSTHYCRLLLLLENIMSGNEAKSEYVVTRVLGGISWSKPNQYRTHLLNRLVFAINNSGFFNQNRKNSVCSNAGSFGNYQLIQVLLENNVELPVRILQKAQSDYWDMKEKGKDAQRYRMICKVITEFKLKAILNEVKEKIKSHKFVLNGGGDSSIAEIGHPVTLHAAKIYSMTDAALKSGESLVDVYYKLATDAIAELRIQDKGWTSMLGMFSVRGERDSTTTNCYDALIKIITTGLTYLREYAQLLEDSNDDAQTQVYMK